MSGKESDFPTKCLELPGGGGGGGLRPLGSLKPLYCLQPVLFGKCRRYSGMYQFTLQIIH